MFQGLKRWWAKAQRWVVCPRMSTPEEPEKPPTTLDRLREWLAERPDVKRVRMSPKAYTAIVGVMARKRQLIRSVPGGILCEGIEVIRDRRMALITSPLFFADEPEPPRNIKPSAKDQVLAEARAVIASGLRGEPQSPNLTLADALVDLLGLREHVHNITDLALIASYNEPAKAVVTYFIRQDMVNRLAACASMPTVSIPEAKDAP